MIVLMEKPTEKQKVGQLGENIASKYLENRGFTIVERNYRKKCGEIDIIAKKGGITHFVEVKTVSELANSRLGRSENIGDFKASVSLRPRVCAQGVRSADSEFANSETDRYRPEDNIHPFKLNRLSRAIQLYLYEKHSNGSPEWIFDVVTVQLDTKNKRAKVDFLENIII